MAQSAPADGVSAAADVNPAATADTGPQQAIGYGALPGGIFVPDAQTLAKGAVEVISIDGFGYRKGLLATDHTMTRTLGAIAAAYGINDFLSVGLSLDGRYDRHHGPMPSPDDGYVGDPHLLIRAAKAAGTTRFGGQIGIWVPGKDAPSIAGSAISIDVRGLASLPAGPGILSFEAGFLFDNSAKSVDDPSKLSLQDRVSLGVSDYNTVYGGGHLAVPFGSAWIGLEASITAYLGSAPTTAGVVTAGHAELEDGKLLLEAGASAGVHLNDMWALLAYAEIAKSPYVTAAQVMDGNIPLIPYQPVFTAGIGLSARFGAKKEAPAFKGCAFTPEGCPAVEVPILADIRGMVVDESDKPLIGAKVSIQLKNLQVEPVATDEHGAYEFKGVAIGKKTDATKSKPATHEILESSATISIAVDGKKPGTATIAKLDEGPNTVPPTKLEPLLPPGQLRGVIHSLPAGQAVEKAVITVSPGDKKVESGADGTFTIDLAPGSYKITVKATGFAPQDLDVNIQPDGVAIKNIDLHK